VGLTVLFVVVFLSKRGGILERGNHFGKVVERGGIKVGALLTSQEGGGDNCKCNYVLLAFIKNPSKKNGAGFEGEAEGATFSSRLVF